MSDQEKNVYGENHPKEEVKEETGIREEVAEKDKEKDTAADLEETRRQVSQETKTGGMGRETTPKEDTVQGSWNRPGED